jgi:hypothetical protein
MDTGTGDDIEAGASEHRTPHLSIVLPHPYLEQRGKVALKRLLIVGALAAASAFPLAMSAHAADTCTPDPAGVGTACAGGTGPADGHIVADGNDSNPCPISGYLAADQGGVSGAASGGYQPGANYIIPPSGAAPSNPC